MAQNEEEKLKNFLRANGPQPPRAPQGEWEQIQLRIAQDRGLNRFLSHRITQGVAVLSILAMIALSSFYLSENARQEEQLLNAYLYEVGVAYEFGVLEEPDEASAFQF